MKQTLSITILLLILGCYVPSATYKEVEERDEFANTHIIRQKDNGIMGSFTECNGCWFYFDIVYDIPFNIYNIAIQYDGDDWLFINQIIFLADGDRIVLPFKGQTDVYGGGRVIEADGVNIKKEDLLKIVNATELSCRLSGKYYYDIDNKAIKPIQNRWKQFTEGMLKPYMGEQTH